MYKLFRRYIILSSMRNDYNIIIESDWIRKTV